jgi:hypothetical protein
MLSRALVVEDGDHVDGSRLALFRRRVRRGEKRAEFPEIFNHCSVQLLENAATAQVGHHPFTEAERRKRDAGTTEETIAIDRLWNKRPDGHVAEAQYAPIKSALQQTLGFRGWTVNQ